MSYYADMIDGSTPLEERLRPCLNSLGRLNSRALSDEFLQKIGVLNELVELRQDTPLLNHADTIRWVLMGRPEFPVCSVCHSVHIRFGYDTCTEHRHQSEKTKNTRKQTNLAKYGGPAPTSSEETRKKSKQTMLAKYGVAFNSQRTDIKDEITSTRMSTLKERYGDDWARHLFQRASERFDGLHPFLNQTPVWKSKAEGEIIDRLRDAVPGIVIVQSDRTQLQGKEIDVWLPEYRVGIEHSGIVWHSECMWEGKWSNAKYHIRDKTLLARTNSVDLMTIWDTEWNNRSDQCLNLILGRLGVFQTRVGARACEIEYDTDRRELAEFIARNHIQPIPMNRLKYSAALRYRGLLVSVLTVGHHHRSSGLVLNRMCTERGWQVVGGASRMFQGILKEHGIRRVLSWSDERLSRGAVYEHLGFRRDLTLPPSYSYVDRSGTRLIPAQAATKTLLGAREGQTERERASELGMCRVWDAGKVRWVYES